MNKYFGFAILALAIGHSAAMPNASAREIMPATTQNALVQKYCAVCHTDAARTGGLSLEHFDAARVAPSLAAMMLSKVRSGAMGAANITLPDKPTLDAFAAALAAEAKGAAEWSVITDKAVTTASILRELRVASKPGGISSYRLVLSCDASSGKGEMQLAWSPLPVKGTLTVMLGTKPMSYSVDGADFREFPLFVSDRIVFSGLFTGETVEISFAGLAHAARRALAPCFRD